MEENNYPQCRIVPIQMLKAENAEKFLDGLSQIPGIVRMLVHGPGYLQDLSGSCCVASSQPPSSSPIQIADHPVRMHVLMGDVIVEAAEEEVFDIIADYCLEFFDDMGFQVLVGKFIKTAPSQSDYLKKDVSSSSDLLGLSDYKQSIDPYIIPYGSDCQDLAS